MLRLFRKENSMKKNVLSKILMLGVSLCVLLLTLVFSACGNDPDITGNAPMIDGYYTFAAALTDLDEVEGEGFSGGTSGKSMIAQDVDIDGKKGAWNTVSGYFVTYLYVKGTAITFVIQSDKDVQDAEIRLCLSAEADELTEELAITDDMYTVEVNSAALKYADIIFYNVPASGTIKKFSKYTLAKNVSLKAGENVIRLITSNDVPLGGTANATAPMVDCLQIKTKANLSWTPRTDNLLQEHFI